MVYDNVSDYYKVTTQNTIYINNIHPIEAHDSVTMDNTMGWLLVGKHWTMDITEESFPKETHIRKVDYNRGKLNLKGKA